MITIAIIVSVWVVAAIVYFYMDNKNNRQFIAKMWEEKALLDAEMDRLMAATYREKVTDE